MQWNCSIQLEKNSIQDSAASQFELKMIILIIDQSLYSLPSLLFWHRFWPSIAWHPLPPDMASISLFARSSISEFEDLKNSVTLNPDFEPFLIIQADHPGTTSWWICPALQQDAPKCLKWPIRCGFQYEVHSMRFTNMESNSMKSTSSPQHEAHTMKSIIVKPILVDCMLIVRTSPRLQAVTRVRLLSYRPEITLRSRSVPKKRRVAFLHLLHLLSFSCNTQQPEGQNKLCCFLTFKLIVTVLIR